MEKVTPDTIIETMKTWVEERHPIRPNQWLDAAAKLNVLTDSITVPMYQKEHYLAVRKAELMGQEKMTNAHAQSLIEADEEFMQTKLLRAKLKQVEEFIRLAKKQATISNEDYNRQ